MRIALCQITSSPQPRDNLELIADRVHRAHQDGARVVVFPEATMARFGTSLAFLAEPLDGPWADAIRRIATEAGVTVIAGMFAPAEHGRVFNRLLITGGGVDTHYDKIHLYDAHGFAESNTVAPGDQPVLVEVESVSIGMATWYDVRFPGLFTTLADRGATVILLPASWGAGPGKLEQWRVLTQARALDSTSWLLACGQADPRTIGVEPHPRAPTGIGHSIAVSPLGSVIGELGDAPDTLLVDVDHNAAYEARRSLPVLANRRF